MPKRCAVFNCRGNYDGEPYSQVVSFPTDRVERTRWIETMGVNPGGDGGDTYINCPPHFLSGLDSSIVVLKYCFNTFTRIK